jgi:hypothetical protein
LWKITFHAFGSLPGLGARVPPRAPARP